MPSKHQMLASRICLAVTICLSVGCAEEPDQSDWNKMREPAEAVAQPIPLYSLPELTKDGMSVIDRLSDAAPPSTLNQTISVYGYMQDCLPQYGQAIIMGWPIVDADQFAEFAPNTIAALPSTYQQVGDATYSSQRLTLIGEHRFPAIDAQRYAEADQACRSSSTGIRGFTTFPILVLTGQVRQVTIEGPLRTADGYAFVAHDVKFVRQMSAVEMVTKATVQKFIDEAI